MYQGWLVGQALKLLLLSMAPLGSSTPACKVFSVSSQPLQEQQQLQWVLLKELLLALHYLDHRCSCLRTARMIEYRGNTPIPVVPLKALARKSRAAAKARSTSVEDMVRALYRKLHNDI